MKKLILSLSMILCFSCLAACGKKDDTTEEFKPNYAVNDTKAPTEEEEYQTTENITTPSDSHYSSTANQDIYSSDYKEETTSVVNNNIVFTYPTTVDTGFYINSIRVAETIPFGFSFNDISANLTDGQDIIAEQSNSNKIFCQGYSNNLKLVDTDIMSTPDQTLSRLALIAPAIEYIQLGNYQYKLNELLYNTNNFEDMIKMFSNNYTIKPLVDIEGNILSYDKNDIYSYAKESDGNCYGKSYTWTFEWLDENEYTEEEKSMIYDKIGEIPSNTITILAEYDSEGTLVYYTFNIKKAAHFWVEEVIHIETTGELVTNEDGTVSENNIEETEVHTGIFNCSQDGYYFNDGYMKTIDGSFIGLNKIEITIHNHDCAFNKNKSFDYIIE